MLKISFFCAASHTQGTYFRWHNLAIALQMLGHKVTVHAIGPQHRGRTQYETRDGVNYIIVPLTPYLDRLWNRCFDPVTLLRSLRHIQGSCDICHVFQPFPHSCLPTLLGCSGGSRLVFDWDDLWGGGLLSVPSGFPWPATWLTGFVNWLEKVMPGFTGAVTSCSDFLALKAEERGASQTQVIHNGYWPDRHLPSKIDARATLKLCPDAYYFGFMGRTLGEIKWCLDALQARPIPNKPIRLAMCGMPLSVLHEVSPLIQARIDYLGQLSPDLTSIFARAIDVGLLPLEDNPFNQSRFPIKFAEYLAGGAHVALSSVGECANVAKNLPGVTLCGTSRESWQHMLSSTDWSDRCVPFQTASYSVLADTLGWPALALQLETFYKTLATS
jgi:glycosyltransferase involved in cell wall biosynthesis